jgi:hypothetical protein
MTIKLSRSRSLVGVVGLASKASRQKRRSIGSGLIALALAAMGGSGCPGQLEGFATYRDGGRPPPPPTGGSGGGGVRGGQGGGAAQRVDARVDGAQRAAANCWEPAEITNKILLPKCATAACHDSVMPAASLDLQAAGARMRLQNIPSRLCAAGGTSRTLVTVQGNAVGGHLFDKLTGRQPAECGQRMPRNGMMAGYLSDAEVQCMREWFVRNGGQRPPDAGPAPAPPPPPPPTPGCANPSVDAIAILTAKCAACHDPRVPALFIASQLDLATPGAKARLNVASRQCFGRQLLIPGRPEGFFFDKLAGQFPMNCGQRMPPAGEPLSANEIKCLKDWIAPGIAQ